MGSRNSIKAPIVGIAFKPTADWVGGRHYLRSLVIGLSEIESPNQPSIVLIGNERKHFPPSSREYDVAAARIRPVQFWKWGWLCRRVKYSGYIDVVLPTSVKGAAPRSVVWIPDFQEEHLPHLFSSREIKARRKRNRRSLREHRHIMVSSFQAKRDLEKFYGPIDNLVHVVRFTSFIDRESPSTDFRSLTTKYQIPDQYFICSNQLWSHKNHTVILRAVAKLGRSAPSVLFTGAESDYRDRSYGPSLRKLAADLNVDSRIKFLGLVPRADHVALLKGASAIIQPSLFEGWSTAVEDAKALGKYLFASDIAVHREQISNNVAFFDPHNVEQLASLIERSMMAPPKVNPVDYTIEQRRFSDMLLQFLNTVMLDFTARGIAKVQYV